eukprot:evm.model.scf_804.7 EVM.evm.TU.scf_804.7   scf_804:56760-59729(+)
MATAKTRMRPLRRSLQGGGARVLGGTARLASRTACRRARRRAGPSLQVVASLCPYQTLGVSETADMKEIKNAYRKMALRHHPDREGGSEAMFLAIHEAYEILLGMKLGKNTDHSTGWDFHDWYWKFLMQRTSKHTRPREYYEEHRNGSASREQVRSQLAGLRHRAAVRAQRMRANDEQQQHGDEWAGPAATSGVEGTRPVRKDDGSQAKAAFSKSKDYNEAATADSEAEEGRQTYARLCEEARRRQSLSGTEPHKAVRSQLAGLKRRANMRREMDEGN